MLQWKIRQVEYENNDNEMEDDCGVGKASKGISRTGNEVIQVWSWS